MKEEEYKRRVKEKHGKNIKILSDYLGSNEKIDAKCRKHEEVFRIIATRLSQGQTGCKQCKEESMKEEDIQSTFVSWYRKRHPDHIITCNGIFNCRMLSEKAYEMGYYKGFPDIFIVDLKLFIEFKNGEKGIVSKEQIECHEKLRKLGYEVHVCRTHGEAVDIVKEIEKKITS